MPCVRISKFSRMGSWFLTHSSSWDGLCNLCSVTSFKVVWPFQLLQPFKIDCKICEVKLSSLAGDQGPGWSRTIVVFIFRASFLIRYISGGGGGVGGWVPPEPLPQIHPVFVQINPFNPRDDQKRNCAYIINAFFKQERIISTIVWSDLILLSISTQSLRNSSYCLDFPNGAEHIKS